jgi:hypothetical protein
MTVTARDADLPPQPLAFSIVGGADQSRFNITPGGALSFNAPPDFEAPADANGDNTYIVIVQASDGQLTNLQAVLVTVTNASEVQLPGDFNNNGTVDAADYVLWRNGGPLANDPTPGVQPDDYNYWRANFGRTVGAGSHAEGTRQEARSGASEPLTAAPSEDDSAVSLSFESSPLVVDLQSRQIEAIERRIHRPTRRAAFAAPSTRDDAIVAWLASRWDELARSFHDIVHPEFVSALDPSEPAKPSLAELDLALAVVFN